MLRMYLDFIKNLTVDRQEKKESNEYRLVQLRLL